MSIKVRHAALDEFDGQIVLRGRIDPVSLGDLKVGPYQRELLPKSKIGDLKTAFKDPSGSVPDLDLGMRGGNFSIDKKAPTEHGEVLILHDPVFIIDGLQRTTAAKELLLEGCEARIGAMIHFGTTEEWEQKRFYTLNVARTRLSPN